MTEERQTTPMRLVKIIYGYDIETDTIKAKQQFVAAEDDEPVDMTLHADAVDCTMDCTYSKREWENQLYAIKSKNRVVEIVKAIDEVMRR